MEPDTPVGGSATILLVEDDAAVRRLTALVLERSGYRVMAADGADEAVRLASSGAVIHLIIMDVMIPGSAGAQVARRLSDCGLQAPVLFISGYEAASLRRQGRLAEGSLFLQKPFTRVELLVTVSELINASAGTPVPPPHGPVPRAHAVPQVSAGSSGVRSGTSVAVRRVDQ